MKWEQFRELGPMFKIISPVGKPGITGQRVKLARGSRISYKPSLNKGGDAPACRDIAWSKDRTFTSSSIRQVMHEALNHHHACDPLTLP